MKLFSVRGAVQLDKNNAANMENHVTQLLTDLVETNGINETEIVHILFTQTKDLTRENPARALRKSGFQNVPLFCSLEPQYPRSLKRTVRVLVTYYHGTDHQPSPIYLNGAQILRTDLFPSDEVL